MRRFFWAPLVGLALLTAPVPARAQVASGYSGNTNLSAIYGAPGNYGVAYGSASYGFPRTYSAFSSPYGVGYGYGYDPSGLLPGRFGVGLWRPGYMVPGYAYGASAYQYYRTFPYPLRPFALPAPLGYFAPAFGPPSNVGW